MTAWGWGGGNDKTFTMPPRSTTAPGTRSCSPRNGTTLILYIDGVALPAQAATRATVMDAYGFGIGAVINPDDINSGGFFNGSIDEVSFYTSVLSQATVTDHYQLGGAPSVDTTGPTGGSVDASGLVGTGSRYAHVDDAEPGAGQGHRPERRGHHRQPAAARHCLAHRRHLRQLRQLQPWSPADRPDLAARRHGGRPGLLPLPVRRAATRSATPTTYTSPDIKVDSGALAAPIAGVLGVHQHLGGRAAARRSTTARPRHRLGHASPRRPPTRRPASPSYAFPALGSRLDLDARAPPV